MLAAVDGSDNSMRALRFAVEFADRFDGELDVVHVTDRETEATEEVLRRVDEVLASAGGEADFELDVVEGLELPTAREAGKELLSLVSDRGYDHVVVGHHGAGHIERAILGSASETVVRGTSVPVTVVP
ncbi:universal stress protein uspa-like protein [Candidatus Halobonum tyrrellensis G22]|uniref:Universal stress protein uspa-like protein n=1 Tax=Candidatus Halobonum tyrrellensis G22 TaxID=1324957 RepID=V4GS18_9EURY|nr:universal stress protein uspa-like protein [Candidatus Halobonum tyrrellensis G22]